MDQQDNYQGERLVPLDIERELKNSFIAYAMAVIVSRALPDVRDGLKPVHRRILYAMTELGMTPDKPFRKSARIVGDVLGKYHPHGDMAVYDAMVRLAQDFSMRYMLVEGQGNFGSVDGDSPAAMRYTEARLSRIAADMTADLDKQTVDFYPNFDETLMQPEVLPSRFPNLLVNGSGGIAVGMATNIPPHNMGEAIDGVVYMLDHPDCTAADLMKIIKGPDFPTGGLIMGLNGIKSAYLTGKGRIIMRARTEIEPMSATRSRIVVTEIPYQVNKARLVEKIAELVHDKRVDGISDLRDESDRQGMRIVIELKKDVNPQVVLNTLFKHTQMQETFGVTPIPGKEAGQAVGFAGGETWTMHPQATKEQMDASWEILNLISYDEEFLRELWQLENELGLLDPKPSTRQDLVEVKYSYATNWPEHWKEEFAALNAIARPEPFCNEWNSLKDYIVQPFQQIIGDPDITREEAQALLDECAERLYTDFPEAYKKPA